MEHRAQFCPLLIVLALLTGTATTSGAAGLALHLETGLASYALSDVPAALSLGADLGYRTDCVAFTLGYAAEPFAEFGGVQAPRLQVYYFTNPAHPFSLRLGGGLDYYWRLSPFGNEERAEGILGGRLGLQAALNLVDRLAVAVDAGLLFPLTDQVGLATRFLFALVYRL
ncbi:MAG: hypothetical protein GF399_04180 [Candidatus Coatesbacteria bacterium]|nr:hypothetical protein [Candidatus Coatesbacteria bacterium]